VSLSFGSSTSPPTGVAAAGLASRLPAWGQTQLARAPHGSSWCPAPRTHPPNSPLRLASTRPCVSAAKGVDALGCPWMPLDAGPGTGACHGQPSCRASPTSTPSQRNLRNAWPHARAALVSPTVPSSACPPSGLGGPYSLSVCATCSHTHVDPFSFVIQPSSPLTSQHFLSAIHHPSTPSPFNDSQLFSNIRLIPLALPQRPPVQKITSSFQRSLVFWSLQRLCSFRIVFRTKRLALVGRTATLPTWTFNNTSTPLLYTGVPAPRYMPL